VFGSFCIAIPTILSQKREKTKKRNAEEAIKKEVENAVSKEVSILHPQLN
jgi:hypothetical protein